MCKKIIEMREKLIAVGNNAKATYDETKDLKAALVAIRAYGEVTRTAIAQIRYKQSTATPVKIEFLEE
jgi:hypothetical protein